MWRFKRYLIYILPILALLAVVACDEPNDEPQEEQAPEIVVLGANPLKTGIYASFVDDSVKILSSFGLDTAWSVREVDTSRLGKYTVEYYTCSLSGLEATAQRDVWVVVMPKSMADSTWQVQLTPEGGEASRFNDTLTASNDKNTFVIKNFHNIKGAAVSLELAAELGDSVYISKQELDTTATVEGKGTIDNKALLMQLNYFLVSDEDTLRYKATYTRDSIQATTL